MTVRTPPACFQWQVIQARRRRAYR